jgi:hypothetical protein
MRRGFIAASVLAAVGSMLQGAAEAPTRKTPNRCSDAPDRFVAERLQVWQQRLGLEQWKFALVFSRPGDLKPNTVGNIHWDAATKSATIRLLAVSEYPLDCPDTFRDLEFTIVHELLHLKVSVLPRCEAVRKEEEATVNEIATTLLMLDRRVGSKMPAGSAGMAN